MLSSSTCGWVVYVKEFVRSEEVGGCRDQRDDMLMG